MIGVYIPAPATPAMPSKPISFTLSKTPKIARLHDSAAAMQVDQKSEENVEDQRTVDCKVAHPILVAAFQTFNKVDIKVRPSSYSATQLTDPCAGPNLGKPCLSHPHCGSLLSNLVFVCNGADR